MKVEIRTTGQRDNHFDNVNLVVIEPDENTVFSISASGVEIETFDDHGMKLSQQWFDTSQLVEMFNKGIGG